MPIAAPTGDARDLRDRFLAFAFAAADLLVEADAEGRVTFAAGAFHSRLGEAPETFVGGPVQALVAPEDRAALYLAVRSLSAVGRLPPTALRLNDRRRSDVVVSGLAPPGPGMRLFLTFGPHPGPRPSSGAIAPESLSLQAEGQVRDGSGGTLGLLELPGGADVALARAPALRDALIEGLGNAGELAPGRYGMLTAGEDALAALAGTVEEILAAHGVRGPVATRSLSLEAGSLTTLQATRALRHALAAFAREGVAGADGAGVPAGLGGAVARLASDAAAVRRAVSSRRFGLVFQPIVRIADGVVHHHEALLRPPAGLPEPLSRADGFVRCAEAVGMTEALDLAVVEMALRALAGSPAASVAVNLSGLSVQSPEFRAGLLAMLDEHPASTSRLLIEVTESAEIEDEGESVRTLDRLRERGVGLCLDDFGAGAAAFRYLRAFRVDWVKIDGLYVSNAVHSERDRAFIASMVDLSAAVGANVIAERVETQAEAAALRELGVAFAQGWLYGRPGPLPRTGATARRGTGAEVWA
ncbi:sensor domain-containing phosphodiesterase [Roseomonas sp. WA12]